MYVHIRQHILSLEIPNRGIYTRQVITLHLIVDQAKKRKSGMYMYGNRWKSFVQGISTLLLVIFIGKRPPKKDFYLTLEVFFKTMGAP